MRHRHLTVILFALAIAAATSFSATAETPLGWEASVTGNASTGKFAPYFIGSLNNGRLVRAGNFLLEARAEVAVDRSRRFSWGAGIDLVGGYSSANEYALWNETGQSWTSQQNRPAAAWIQQLYAEIKYRGVLLRAGQRDPRSAMLDNELSSGDLTLSSNARGIPGVSLGFVDFQDIPLTNGWVQIDGVVEYGRFTDDGFTRKQYNRYNWMTTSDVNFTYKRCYFRTKPSMPLSFTLGMQTAGQFGGSTMEYSGGRLVRSEVRGFRLKDMFKMFFPTQGNGNNFYEGNSLGSWDFKVRYRLRSGHELSFAFQWPWEDGSGIGRRNGWDGLWGLYYRTPGRALVSGAAIEYIDFRNQSGPIHWAPADNPGTTITGQATGGDNYYNNDTYCCYANYGMAIATPFLVSPIYNLNGYPAFLHNCARGFHAAVTGNIGDKVDYILKYSWQQAWGMGRKPQPLCSIDNSMLLKACWDASALTPGLKVSASVAFDAGKLRGDNFGAVIGIAYSGVAKLFKKQ